MYTLSYQNISQVIKQNVTGLQWIATWQCADMLVLPQSNPYMPYLRGTLGFAIRRGDIPGLKDYMLKVHPDNNPDYMHEHSVVCIESFKLLFQDDICLYSNNLNPL